MHPQHPVLIIIMEWKDEKLQKTDGPLHTRSPDAIGALESPRKDRTKNRKVQNIIPTSSTVKSRNDRLQYDGKPKAKEQPNEISSRFHGAAKNFSDQTVKSDSIFRNIPKSQGPFEMLGTLSIPVKPKKVYGLCKPSRMISGPVKPKNVCAGHDPCKPLRMMSVSVKQRKVYSSCKPLRVKSGPVKPKDVYGPCKSVRKMLGPSKPKTISGTMSEDLPRLPRSYEVRGTSHNIEKCISELPGRKQKRLGSSIQLPIQAGCVPEFSKSDKCSLPSLRGLKASRIAPRNLRGETDEIRPMEKASTLSEAKLASALKGDSLSAIRNPNPIRKNFPKRKRNNDENLHNSVDREVSVATESFRALVYAGGNNENSDEEIVIRRKRRKKNELTLPESS